MGQFFYPTFIIILHSFFWKVKITRSFCSIRNCDKRTRMRLGFCVIRA